MKAEIPMKNLLLLLILAIIVLIIMIIVSSVLSGFSPFGNFQIFGEKSGIPGTETVPIVGGESGKGNCVVGGLGGCASDPNDMCDGTCWTVREGGREVCRCVGTSGPGWFG